MEEGNKEEKMTIPRQKKERLFNDPGKTKKSYFDFGWFVVVMVFEILVIAFNYTQYNTTTLVFVFAVAIISSLIISTIARHLYGDISSGDKT